MAGKSKSVGPVEIKDEEQIVGLYRVSTQDQEDSGLGLKAQKSAVRAFAERIGGNIIREFDEATSGTHDEIEDRPTLRDALAFSYRTGALLVVSRMDRLTRSPSLFADLNKQGYRFVAADNPYATELTTGILIHVGAEETRKISMRVRVALAQFKAERRVPERIRDAYKLVNLPVPPDVVEATAGKLGSQIPACAGNLSAAARKLGSAASAQAKRLKRSMAYRDLIPRMAAMRAAGESFAAIAAKLNEGGERTRQKRPWSKAQVWRLLGGKAAPSIAPAVLEAKGATGRKGGTWTWNPDEPAAVPEILEPEAEYAAE
jgi:DNA invertase Pin-like site-specific DNA recombinase